ncbi:MULTISPECIES: hypothetical protein [unclassified Streptomyces]|uniref:hypothetical protein n=1 Tax=unclassified Streptomyces TaxID=2593676 RepID=UPI00114D3A59|nr:MULTISPECIES: hypothetical protein [unclassified Streptomyces]MYQ82347.1 hypothetical protein [Streptomyces sp. SID4936]
MSDPVNRSLAAAAAVSAAQAADASRLAPKVSASIESGADKSARDEGGCTPLHDAVRTQRGSEDVPPAAVVPARFGHPPMKAGPLPIDMVAARRVVAARQVRMSEARAAAGVPDESEWLTELVRPEFKSFEDFVSGPRCHDDPDRLPLIPGLCAEILGDDVGTERALTGDQDLDVPFFHHGDLVVDGNLDVAAEFVVTGSLRVSGILADSGPDSVVAIGGDVRARAVHTDGAMSVGGDIEAEVVYGYYHYRMLRAGTIRARLVIDDEHHTDAVVQANTYFDADHYQQGYGKGVQEVLRELLVDEVFANDEDEEEEHLYRELLFERLRKGEPVFRTIPAAAN